MGFFVKEYKSVNKQTKIMEIFGSTKKYIIIIFCRHEIIVVLDL